MTFTILVFLYRKPGSTMEHFINYYEDTHIQVLRSITGPDFPASHTRHYTQRTEANTPGGPANPTTPATLFQGKQEDVDFDCVAEITFEDHAAFQRFFKAISSPEGGAKLKGDELNFLDPTKSTVVARGAVHVTRGC